MKKLITLLFIAGSLFLRPDPVLGQTPLASPPGISRQLNDLANRFNSLEASWGRFQIGGNFSIEADSGLENHYTQFQPLTFEQKMGLYLNAGIDQNLSFSLNLSHDGGWGNYSRDPLAAPLQLDEAFIKMEYPHTSNYLGRFRFSFGPLGLISDFFNNPAEGLVLQHAFKDFHVIGLYSRMYTQYVPGTTQLQSTQDYFATRLGWSNQSTIIGLNLVPKGMAAEKAFSLDLSTTLSAGKIAAEVGWYSFDSPRYPDFRTGWTPGVLISFGHELKDNAYFQAKLGYISQNFQPTATSLNHAPDDMREWFTPNNYGLELSLQNKLENNFLLENRLLVTNPVKDVDQSGTNYRWRGDVAKILSPLNQVQFGVEVNQNRNSNHNFLFASWNLQF